MPAKTVEFYFDFGSPAAWLAHTQMAVIARDTGATVVYRSMLLGGVFQSTGNRPPISVPLKGSYLFTDLSRFARRYGVPLVMNPAFPINTITLMRIDVGLERTADPRLAAYRDAMFRAIWVDQKNLNDPATVAQVLTAGGFDPQQMLALASDPAVKEDLRARTQAAVDRGIFGAPTFFVGDAMFWGQDRLDFVREALQA
ncbi:MAG: 2-hydroxychromene-2-carboxylate isomerase [Rhodoferax sp.]|nr:2-hydroxychromene-2-carboxylate isomerase [Rhodoferax sp.]